MRENRAKKTGGKRRKRSKDELRKKRKPRDEEQMTRHARNGAVIDCTRALLPKIEGYFLLFLRRSVANVATGDRVFQRTTNSRKKEGTGTSFFFCSGHIDEPPQKKSTPHKNSSINCFPFFHFSNLQHSQKIPPTQEEKKERKKTQGHHCHSIFHFFQRQAQIELAIFASPQPLSLILPEMRDLPCGVENDTGHFPARRCEIVA